MRPTSTECGSEKDGARCFRMVHDSGVHVGRGPNGVKMWDGDYCADLVKPRTVVRSDPSLATEDQYPNIPTGP